jgi:uncharacterized membrane protein SpoIIM required for sporulation/ABC-type transport system involved in multi-copper enzyme maturation permease subunit
MATVPLSQTRQAGFFPAIELNTVLTIIRREVRDNLRDWRIVTPTLILTTLFPFIMNFTAGVMFNFLAEYDATLIGERLIPFGMMIVGFFPITFSLVIALESFVGEKERHSLEALLASPASDFELYLGKLLSSLVIPISSSFIGIAVYLLFVTQGNYTELPPSLVIQILLLTVLEAIAMVAGAVIISSHTTSVRAANLLASFIIVPAALLLQLEAVCMFWATYDTLWYIALGLVVVVIIFVRAGSRTFNRETILSREMDTLNLRSIFRSISRFWHTNPTQLREAARGEGALPRLTLRRFYQQDLPIYMRSATLPIGLATLVMVGGFIFGWLFAYQYPLPAQLIQIDPSFATQQSLANSAPGWSLLPKFSFGAIFGHNLRATILALMFALLSFGSISLLLIGLPMGVVGFLTGQIANTGQDPFTFLAAFILPHGIIELPATLIAAAFAVRIGARLIAPPDRLTVGEGLLSGLVDFAKIMLFLVIPMLIISSIIEVYITPQVIQWLY